MIYWIVLTKCTSAQKVLEEWSKLFRKKSIITIVKLSFFFQIQMTTDSLLTIVITPPPNSTEALTEWHRTGERQFIISVNDSWSIWALAECETPGQLSYSFNITPLPTPDCQPLIQRSVCDEYYQTIAMPNRFGLTDQNFVYTYFEFGLSVRCRWHYVSSTSQIFLLFVCLSKLYWKKYQRKYQTSYYCHAL